MIKQAFRIAGYCVAKERFLVAYAEVLQLLQKYRYLRQQTPLDLTDVAQGWIMHLIVKLEDSNEAARVKDDLLNASGDVITASECLSEGLHISRPMQRSLLIGSQASSHQEL